MESTNIKFAQYGGANECAKTDMLLLLLSEISTGAVSLKYKNNIVGNVQITLYEKSTGSL